MTTTLAQASLKQKYEAFASFCDALANKHDALADLYRKRAAASRDGDHLLGRLYGAAITARFDESQRLHAEAAHALHIALEYELALRETGKGET